MQQTWGMMVKNVALNYIYPCRSHGLGGRWLKILQGYCRGIAGVLQGSCRGIAGVLQGYCRGIAGVLQGYCRGIIYTPAGHFFMQQTWGMMVKNVALNYIYPCRSFFHAANLGDDG